MVSEQSTAPDGGRRLRRRLWIAARIVVCLLVAAVCVATASVYFGSEHLANQVDRYPGVFAEVPEESRPPETEALTILLVGSDSLASAPTTGSTAVSTSDLRGSGRSDVIMLMRIDKGFTHATVVSFPRDSWVLVPGRGMMKINASFAIGGPSLLVRTIEDATDIRVDHFAVVDFTGFQALTDAVGGIVVDVAARTTFGSLVLHAGKNHLDGKQALAYVRQRKGLPRGDLDRVRRHQSAIRALFTKAASDGLLDPVRGYDFALELTRWITVDDTLTNDQLRTIAMRLPALGVGGITFLTAPVAGLGREDKQSVVYLDAARCARLWERLSADDVDSYLRTDPTVELGQTNP
ncbi:LCP family protein [Actinophytocola sp.]|uniref:LCP family protein n=1 Tax=Actinophytocola sp. TaxID=1872138 RepID=UPI002ED113BA